MKFPRATGLFSRESHHDRLVQRSREPLAASIGRFQAVFRVWEWSASLYPRERFQNSPPKRAPGARLLCLVERYLPPKLELLSDRLVAACIRGVQIIQQAAALANHLEQTA